MRSSKDRSALFDIRDNAALARGFVGTLTLSEFQADRRAFYAATRALEIISEAARRLAPSVRERHPELPWRAIIGVGNVLRHNYDDVAEEQVWRTVLEDLPALDRAIAAELEQNE
jgi:uncharacterized protein with HEPN domain